MSDKEIYEELQKMYENKSVTECFASLHAKLEGDVGAVKSEVKGLKDRVENLDAHAQLLEDSVQDIHNKLLPELEDKISKEEKERLKLEYWGRKWNLVIGGVDGTPYNEFPKVTDKAVRAFFVDTLGIQKERIDGMMFQAVHRLSGGKDEKKRRIIVRFSSLIDRDEILAAGMKLQRGSGFSVVPDVPPSVATLRYNLLNERRALPADEQKNVHLVYLKEHPFVMLRRKKSS